MSKYGVISGPYFPIFGLNTGKYGPEITPYLDTFHAVNTDPVKLIRFLGILIDENWQNHFDLVTERISKSIGLLFKATLDLNKKCLTRIYFSLIHSLLNCGNSA